MNLLTLEHISKSYTERILFDDIGLGINDGDKIGVIGINGTGKSTLLKIITGLEDADAGTVTRGKKVQIAYLPQTPVFDPDKTILENVLFEKKAEQEYRNLEGEARAMLLRLGIAECDRTASHLSGGQKKRAALVRTLLTPAQILVLDEPTNHLDNEMAEWLEDYLTKYKGAFIMITHDRYFLDKVTNRIVEIDKGQLYSYTANYSRFLELKAEREEIAQSTERKNKSLYRMELEWMQRGARARSTKQKAHIERFENLRDRAALETDGQVEINSLSSRLGKKTIVLEQVCKAFDGKPYITDFSYILLSTDRIGIIGPNGCGKSTLLKLMTGNLTPDSGSIDCGSTVKVGYFSQENEAMNETLKVIDYIRETADFIQTSDGTITASQMCEKFLFSGSMQYSVIARLSGGEKRRLYLLKILMEAPNILVLDEPTNDLDIQTLTILEDYLKSFPGIIITVSHDRYFLDKIAERIFSFEDGRIRQYEGNFSDYKLSYAALHPEAAIRDTAPKGRAADGDTKKDWRAPRERLKFSYQEQKEFDSIDDDIARLEEKISELDVQITENAANYSRLTELTTEKEVLQTQLNDKMDRWVYLNDLAEQIEAQRN